MHTVDLLEQALDLVGILGYRVRHEWLGGEGGGPCELNGKPVLFLDLAQTLDDQLEQALEALRQCPEVATMPMTDQLRRAIGLRKIA